MAYRNTTVAYSSAGSKTVNLGFQPTGMRITVDGANGTAHSVGTYDGTNQICDWWSNDCTDYDGSSLNLTDRIVSYRPFSGGVATEIIKVNTPAFTATGCTFNVATASSSANLKIELWN